ncbi:MAG: hypothetical protein V9F04_12820 [Dermatophilaceae bacterium]
MSSLRESIDALVAVGVQAGLSESAIRREAMDFAAAIAEVAPQAAPDWAGALDSPPDGLDALHTAFFDAASRGRKYRVAATSLLAELLASGAAKAGEYAVALTEVASAAASLGEPSIRVTANAAGAAASQLQAAQPTGPAPRIGDSMPSWPATPGMPPIWPTPTLTPIPRFDAPTNPAARPTRTPACQLTARVGRLRPAQPRQHLRPKPRPRSRPGRSRSCSPSSTR